MEEQVRERLEAITDAFSENAYKCVISNPVPGAEYRKIEMNRMEGQWYIEKYTSKQVFHEKKPHEDARAFLAEMFGDSFKNINIWSDEYEYTLRLSKK